MTGALTFGVFAGGHFTEAAGLGKEKAEQNVHVKSEQSVKVHVNAKPSVQVKPVAPAVKEQTNSGKASKSQAIYHASENAKLHANPNSAVLGKVGKTEEAKTEEAQVQEPATEEVKNAPADETVENQAATSATTDVEKEETVKTDDEAVKEDDAAVKEDEKSEEVDSDSAVKTEDKEDADKDQDSDSKQTVIKTDAVVKTKDEDEAEAVTEEDDEKEAKVNPSFANKAKSQATHASATALEHASKNSAVVIANEASKAATETEEAAATTEAVT
ncbi:hypothetical protein V7161_02780, partial [Neobacillus drentensis]